MKVSTNIATLLIAAFLAGPASCDVVVNQPSRVSCDASFSTPCGRTNSFWLAQSAAESLRELLEDGSSSQREIFAKVTNKEFNYESGFYPFVFERSSSKCVAHGGNRNLVGLDLDSIFNVLGIEFSNATSLHGRFNDAAEKGGSWVDYIWGDLGEPNSKVAYVTNLTETFYIGVGYEGTQLPPDLPCSDQYSTWCSISNVASLVGKSQFLINRADSIETFDHAKFSLSFDEDFQIPDGFYCFMYSFRGELVGHARLHDYFGMDLPEILVALGLGTHEDGERLHQQFIEAAEGLNDGYVEYQWRNGVTEDSYTKIAQIVKVEFDGIPYYVGSGFNFERDSRVTGPNGRVCTDKYNLPCAFRTALDLASHAFAYAISADLPIEEVFDSISTDPEFRSGDFYVYMYRAENICVAHGLRQDFVGKSLGEVFDIVGIDLDADLLHNKFLEGARAGGGVVLYDWLIPGVPNSNFEKIAYIFHLNVDGVEYYGGVGLNHKRFPVEVYSDFGTKKSGSPIPCSSLYDLPCSEVNARSILGYSLAELTLASTDAIVTSDQDVGRTLEGALEDITFRIDELAFVNDFDVKVFSYDGSECPEQDGSGCLLADGSKEDDLYRTWEEILVQEGITSIRGVDLHQQLVEQANVIGGYVEYSWSTGSGEARRKKAWVTRVRNGGKSYYILAEYFLTTQPPTCDACPSDMTCKNDNDSFCKPKPPLWIPLVFGLAIPVILIAIGVHYCCERKRQRQKRRALKEKMNDMAGQLKRQMQGMREVTIDMPIQTVEAYMETVDATAFKGAGGEEGPRMESIQACWYWEEDSNYVSHHKSSMVLTGSNFVMYSREATEQIEHAYQRWVEGRGFHSFHIDLSDKITSTVTGGRANDTGTGAEYDMNFETFTQNNSKSGHKRPMKREEVTVEVNVSQNLPPLPEDLNFEGEDAENLLPVVKGQVINISKSHPNGEWYFGSVLYDPVLEEAIKQADDANEANGTFSEERDNVLANALHGRPTSGWFPKVTSKPADFNVIHKIVEKLGGEGTEEVLQVPSHWTKGVEGTVPVGRGTPEYHTVADYFTAKLHRQREYVTIKNIERIQNTALYQSYNVKKQSMKSRDAQHPNHIVNNKTGEVERVWLFHGTAPSVVENIIRQGFDRGFAGVNGTSYGRGCYFARDSEYSSHTTYSQPDGQGVQRMFLVRVCVGDWCQGMSGQKTPDPKPHNIFELFDSTVDNIRNPSIYVVFNDAQAYAEYVVSFVRNDRK